MRRSFNVNLQGSLRSPQNLVRGALGVLLLANLVAAWFVFQTPGGTLEQLESDLIAKRKQLVVRQQSLERMKRIAETALKAREGGDRFLNTYFLPRRNAYSMLEVDLANASRSTGIRARERSYSYEPIEGSDTLGMLNISANFEGSYADLMELLGHLDRSKRLLIIEQLQAQPQQGTGALAIVVKMNAFFRLDGPEAKPEDNELLPGAGKAEPAVLPPPPAPVKPVSAVRPPAAGPPTAGQPQIQPPTPQSEPRSGNYPPARRPTFPKRQPTRGSEEEQ